MQSRLLPRRFLLLGCCALAAAACRTKLRAEPHGPIRRVVSLTPNTTEALFAIGAGSLMVGRSRYCDFPPEVARIPVVGGYVDPSFEAILALQPDMVVGARGPAGAAIAERLEARGIRTFFPVTETIAAIQTMIDQLAQLVDRALDGDRVVQAMRQQLASIDQTVAPLRRPRALLVFGLTPTVVAGPESFADEMLVRAGARNAVDAGPRYPTLGIESVIAADPDLIIDAAVAEGHGHERITPDRPGWRELRAVRDGRVAAIDDNVVLRPGPRVPQGVAVLARLLHPGLEL